MLNSIAPITPGVTPLRETTSAVAEEVILQRFPLPLYAHISFSPIPGKCFQNTPPSVIPPRQRSLTAHITEQSCSGFDTLNILQEIRVLTT